MGNEIKLKDCIAPGIRMILAEQFNLTPQQAKDLYNHLEADPGIAEKMFPPAEEDEE